MSETLAAKAKSAVVATNKRVAALKQALGALPRGPAREVRRHVVWGDDAPGAVQLQADERRGATALGAIKRRVRQAAVGGRGIGWVVSKLRRDFKRCRHTDMVRYCVEVLLAVERG